MKHYILVGCTGVGKSSFVNSFFGVELAKTSPYEACTKVVEVFSRSSPIGEVCLLDTPGLAEENDNLDAKYLKLIKQKLHYVRLDGAIYVTPLNETRFRQGEMGAIKKLNTTFGPYIWRHSWLVFTFAASIPAERRQEAAERRQAQIISFINDLTQEDGITFTSFPHVLLLDNVVPNWSPNAKPLSSYFS